MRSRYAIAALFVLLIALIPLIATRVFGQAGAPSRIREAIDNSKLATLRGNLHPMARAEFDRGAAPAGLAMDHMLLVLQRSADQETALEALLAQQQNPSSPNYHKWLTPEEFGRQFGASDADIQKITAWLQSQGFQVNEVAKGRTTIDFSGTAGQVQQAFHAAIHRYVSANAEEHWANATDPQIPTALAPVVAGIHSLNNFGRKRMSHNLGVFRRSKDGKVTPMNPQVTFGGGCNGTGTNCYAVGPADFATIYNVPSSATGTGQTIAIVSDSDISAADVSAFRTLFGLPAINFQQIETGTDPGILPCANGGDECEAVLDVEWAGALAPGAKIDLVVSPTTNTAFGGDTSAQYIISNNLADVLSYSYGACELDLGTAGNVFYQQLWGQAASQGITVLVSTGDNGAAGCDNPSPTNTSQVQPATMGLAVNGVASTAFNVAVGGTDFGDVFNPTTYWNATNSSTTQASAKSYIPELAYNDSCTNPIFAGAGFTGFEGLGSNPESNCNDPQVVDFGGAQNLVAPFGAGGGMSNCTTNSTTSTTGPVSSCSGGYAKPSWQAGPGVPSDGKRDLPDVSLFSGDGTLQNFYIVCQGDENGDSNQTPGTCDINASNGFTEFVGVGGTSVSAQAFAGIMALIDQRTGSRQGNANPVLYTLASEQATSSCNSSASSGPASTCVFNDVTSGTIAMPCAKNSPNCTVSNSSDTIGILTGFSAGTGFDLATGLGSVNVGNLLAKWGPNFYLSSSASSITVSSSSPGTLTITATSVNGFAGAVSLACNGVPSGASCSFNPSSINLTANGSANSTLTVSKASSLLSPSTGSNRLKAPPLVFVSVVLMLVGLWSLLFRAGRYARLALMMFAVWITMAACGGGSSSSSSSSSGSGTGSSTSTATVMGTSNNISYPLSISITVQ